MDEHTIKAIHSSVLLQETVNIVDPQPGRLYVDATLGMGGHSEALLSAAECSVIGIDQDEKALELALARLAKYSNRFIPVKSNFALIASVVSKAGMGAPAGIIADLGISSLQLDTAERGFSFRFDAPLDMRLDQDSDGPTAADLLNSLDETEIADVIYKYGEERASRKIARWIVENRKQGRPVTTTFELADLVRRALKKSRHEKVDPATKTFQALRIAVNRELEVLPEFIDDAVDVLDANGVLAIITFHSLEDRIVKQAFQRLSGRCSCPPRAPVCTCGAAKKVEILTKKPMIASDDEINDNPRSRSAKLRACRRLGAAQN